MGKRPSEPSTCRLFYTRSQARSPSMPHRLVRRTWLAHPHAILSGAIPSQLPRAAGLVDHRCGRFSSGVVSWRIALHADPASRAGPPRAVQPAGAAPVLLLCDHAGRLRAAPSSSSWASSDAALARHIGWDIGAADLTRRARPAAGCAGDPEPRLASGDRPEPPPGHADLDPGDQRRLRRPRQPGPRPRGPGRPRAPLLPALPPRRRPPDRRVPPRRLRAGGDRHAQLHAAHERRGPALAGRRAVARRPAASPGRSWQALEARGDLVVGDNQPYSGLRDFGFTVQFHAQRPACRTSCWRSARTRSRPRSGPGAMPGSSTRRCARRCADPALYRIFAGDNLDPGGGLISWRHAIQSSPLV